jgi:hypothetical protein
MEQSKVFRQRQNDARNIDAIADEYKTKIHHDLWLVDGLQKDAIQNSWDARTDKKHAVGWECGFSLIRIGDQEVLCISDSGTTGLNGTKFFTEDELEEILNKNEKGEDLAYFLNSNWSAKTSKEGGSRGRGKTLFLASSLDRKIFFDSFRSSDKTYLFGELFLDKDKQVKYIPYYSDLGSSKIREITEGKLTPLAQSGTRIFIVHPDTSITQSIRNGEILSFISHSSWERIKKYQSKIFIEFDGEKKYVSLPQWYENKLKDVLTKEFPPEIIREGTSYKTKRLVLRYSINGDLPETIKGIAIQRNGMTIERRLADDLVPHEEGMNNIYGWLEMENNPLEEEMKLKCEGPEHFNFNWTINPAKYLGEYMRSKIKDFAKEFKIISSEQAKKNKVQKLAEEKALKSLSPLFKTLGLSGHHKGHKTRGKSRRKKDEPLRLSVQDIEFPREIRRINYGERINGAYVIPVNDLADSVLVRIHVFIVSKRDGRSIEIGEREINLHPGIGEKIGIDSIIITKDAFEKGEYSLKANMKSLEDTELRLPDGTLIEKGTKLYERVNIKFYVETDPPEHGPFGFQPKSGENKDYLFEWEPDENEGYIIFYNSNHPKIKPLSDDIDRLSNFLTEQGAMLALQIRLEELIAGNESDKEFQELIKSKDISAVWPLFLQKYSEFLWNLNS